MDYATAGCLYRGSSRECGREDDNLSNDESPSASTLLTESHHLNLVDVFCGKWALRLSRFKALMVAQVFDTNSTRSSLAVIQGVGGMVTTGIAKWCRFRTRFFYLYHRQGFMNSGLENGNRQDGDVGRSSWTFPLRSSPEANSNEGMKRAIMQKGSKNSLASRSQLGVVSK